MEGVDLEKYADSLIERYTNPALRHRTWQIAMDGSQKLPQRWLDTIRWHIKHGSRYDLLALGVAGWIRYVGGVDERGEPIEVSDPLLPALKAAVEQNVQGEARVKAILGLKTIFGEDLPANAAFVHRVTELYLELCEKGAKAVVAQF